MPLKKTLPVFGGYMDVSDEERERILDEEIYAAIRLLAMVYPPGCEGMIVIPERAVKKNNYRLTLTLTAAKVLKVIKVWGAWMKKIIIIAVCTIILTGCRVYQVTDTMLVDGRNADKAWSKTQSYIALHSPYRIQVISDYVIDTYFIDPEDCYNCNVTGKIGYTVTREKTNDDYMFLFKLVSYDSGSEKLRAELDVLRKYITTDKVSSLSYIDEDNKYGTIDDIPREVANQALKEMSEKELNSVIRGLSKESLKKMTIEKIRKLYKLEFQD